MSIPRIPGTPQRLADGAPTIDGQLQWYLAESLNESSTTAFCVYVNGIMTDPAGHQRAALDISRRAPCLVLGGFNESGSPGTEDAISYLRVLANRVPPPALGSRPVLRPERRESMAGSAGLDRERTGYRRASSMWDGANAAESEAAREQAVAQVLLTFATSGFTTGARTVGDLLHCMVEWLGAMASCFSQASPLVAGMVSTLMIRFLRERCVAGFRIFELARDFPTELSPLVIVCHSEGNLNTAAGLWALKLQSVARGTPFLRMPVRVLGLASPAPAWPFGVDYHFYRSDWDPVAMLGSTGSGGDSEAHAGPMAFPDSHSVVDYVADPAFIRALRVALGLAPPERTRVADPMAPRDGVGRGAASMSGRPHRR
ncbi:hypothetical protein [Gemmatimonas sp.]|uniref:hypothetical protein n=1 Tax=Gemmatimonas sp. TaxID=1962908 RepID=UPI00286ACACD|nr:hypothetical protein [Gemmatimonas sp.]